MRITRILLLLLFLVSIQNSFGQTNIDAKIEHYFNHFQFDSAYVLIQKNYKKTKINTEKNAEYSIQYAKVLKSLSKPDSCFYFLDNAERFYKKNINENPLGVIK